MAAVAGAGKRSDLVVRSLEPVLDETGAVQLDLVDELDVGRAAPPRHQRGRRRAAVLVADDDAVTDPAPTRAPVVFDVEHERDVARGPNRVGAYAQRRRVGEDQARVGRRRYDA